MSVKLEEEFAQYAEHQVRKSRTRSFKVLIAVVFCVQFLLPVLMVRLAAYSPSTIDAAINILNRIKFSDNPLHQSHGNSRTAPTQVCTL